MRRRRSSSGALLGDVGGLHAAAGVGEAAEISSRSWAPGLKSATNATSCCSTSSTGDRWSQVPPPRRLDR
jgi:hypothetical protein